VPLNKSSELKRRSLRANRQSDDFGTEESSAIQEPVPYTEMAYEHEPELQAENSFDGVEKEPPQMIDITTPSAQIVSADDLLCVTPDTDVNRISASSKQIRDTIKQGEEEMAEVDTTQLSQEHGSIRHDIAVESARIGGAIGSESCAIQKHIGDTRMESAENFGHTRRDIQSTAADVSRQVGAGFAETRFNIAERAGDIRRELADAKDVLNDSIRVEGGSTRFEDAKNTGEIIKEGLKGTHITDLSIKDTRYDLASRVENAADRAERGISELRGNVADRFYTVGRDLSELRQGHATLSKDIELNGLRGIIEGQKNTQYLADKISMDGEKTRALLNDHKYHDLNRALVERQAELVNCEQDRHGYRDRYWDARWAQNQDQFGAQFAAMQNQLQSMNQNFNSQLSETRQGMVNFGTMAGVGQTSSANNVR
jgi:hypothetical protein